MAGSLRSYLRQQSASIGQDPVLRRYGVLLALVHTLTARAWLDPGVGVPVPESLAPGKLALCWPFFPSCADYRFFEPSTLHALVIAYGVLGLVCAGLWLRGHARVAWALHLTLEVARVAVVVQDYRLRLNEHYMALFAAAAFLLLPAQRDLGRVLLVAFYVAAGLLKLTPDWLSGLALPTQPLFVPASLTAAACKYVVVLELVMVWGLLARRRVLFWGALTQVALFHLASFTVVGYFYPVLMAMLLALFVLARREESSTEPSLLSRLVRGGLPRSSYAFLGLFALLQVIPRLNPGDTALTGEGRWLGLHMFDARLQCRAALQAFGTTGRKWRIELPLGPSVRIHCDPLVVRATAAARCAELQATPDFDHADLYLESRHATEKQFQRPIEQPRFCPDVPTYSAFHHNAWIHLSGS